VHRPIRHIRRAMAVALGIDEEVEFITLRRPPRHPYGVGLIELVTSRGPTEVWSVERRALRQVIVLACGRSLVAPVSMRDEEPQPVLLAGTAYSRARIKDIPAAGHGLETAGLQGVGQIGTLQARARAKAGGAARKAVAALLGNHVH